MTAPRPTRVYITNMGRDHQYSAAAQFGAICAVTEGNFPIYAMARLLEEVSVKLADSEPTDYLAISGSAVVAAICLAAWLTKHPKCNLLLYKPSNNSYIFRTLSRDTITKELSRAANGQESQPEHQATSQLDGTGSPESTRGVRSSLSKSRRKEDLNHYSD